MRSSGRGCGWRRRDQRRLRSALQTQDRPTDGDGDEPHGDTSGHRDAIGSDADKGADTSNRAPRDTAGTAAR